MSRLNSSISNFKNNKLAIVFLKVAIFFIVLSLLFWSKISPQYQQSFEGSLIDKMSRLDSLESPKIVLLGNSNVAFGFRSELIEEAFGMEVVNMGLHGGLGSEFHENMVKNSIHSGDIVVLCPTFFDVVGDNGNPELKWITIENHWNLWKCVSYSDWYQMYLAFPSYFKDCISLFLHNTGNLQNPNTCYDRFAFNEYGDNVYAQIDKDTRFEFPEDYKPYERVITNSWAARINNLNSDILNNGGQLFLAGFPIACEQSSNLDQFVDLQERLQSFLNFPVISDYTEYFFPYDFFYDTDYHLTEEGAVARTNQLINDLKPYIKK